MPKKKRVGLIVWGAILITVGGIYLLLLSISALQGRGSASVYAAMAMFFMLILGGAIMLIFGIINVVNVKKYNAALDVNALHVTRCFSCGTEISCFLKDFREHSRYPEGFIYCPVCRKPLSRRAFTVYPSNTPRQQ